MSVAQSRFSDCLPSRLLARLIRVLRREDGTASMEFVLMVPVVLLIFMSSFENGLLMTREILLEQAVDITMRELRLGHYPGVTNAKLKHEICSRTIIFPACESNIAIELDRITTTTWSIPTDITQCVNTNTPVDPVVNLNAGQENDLMLVRVCVSLPAMLPGMGLALSVPLDTLGNYVLLARSAFVVEPS
jgi:Flp pilus assembly protein TadG